MKTHWRIGSRDSLLAVTQTRLVMSLIQASFPEATFECITMKTQGDKILDTRLDKIGGKGLFVKELEQALMESQVDLVVHSLKDMPADCPEGLTLAAMTRREDPRDCILTRTGMPWEALPQGAVIGTSSLRREYQLRALRPDFEFRTLRGNVPTRVRKLDDGEYDAIVLASAGLRRLSLGEERLQSLPPEQMIPAVGQGILGIQTRLEDADEPVIQSLADPAATVCAAAERAFLIALNGGCSIPMAAHARLENGSVRMAVMLGDTETGKMAVLTDSADDGDAGDLGYRLACEIKDKLEKIKKGEVKA